MRYHQLTSEERYMISALRRQGVHQAAIARNLQRHPSTICRELKRNCARYDGAYRPSIAVERTSGRRSRSRKKSQFSVAEWQQVHALLRQDWSPEQITGHLRAHQQLSISHETIYRHVRQDRHRGGLLFQHLRFWKKKWRKLYRSRDSRGRLPGKRMISQRPPAVDRRAQLGHWESDTVMGRYGTKACILTLLERKSGYVMIGKLPARTKEHTNDRIIRLIDRLPACFRTITADNGTEFHGYADIERATPVKFYFAQPYHSWERGSNENVNGLIRQYLPKGASMETLTQQHCDAIAHKLNNRPRKRHGFKTPTQILFRI
jgi:transposase, IS30 family